MIGRATPSSRAGRERHKPKQRKLGPLDPKIFVRFLKPELYLPGLRAESKSELIDELLAGLRKQKPEVDCACILDLLLARERLGTTGLGKGLAIPHVRTALVTALTVVIGKSVEGVPYDARDGKNAHIFFLVLGPHEDPGNLYLSFLSSIVKVFRQRAMKRRLLKTGGFEEFVGMLEDALDSE